MKLKTPGLWLSALSLLVVAALVASDLKRTSPGPLSHAHAQVEALGGSASCDACHGGWRRSMSTSCNECHEEIGRQLEQGTGLHGALAAPDGAICEVCHSEHLGADFSLISAASFSLAGSERETFDHGHVDFDLRGRHTELDCAECHANADVELLEPDTHRFLGLAQSCESCHDDPHEGRFARTCDSCHGQEHPFEDVANFVHVASFPLDGAHGNPACATCHAKASGYEIEDLAGFEPAPPGRSCEDCHANTPHRDAFLDGVAAVAGGERGDACALCHEAVHDSFAGELTFHAELHAASGFALDAPHAELGCVECHSPDGSFAERHPGRARVDCSACHADPHAGQFVETGCLECHRETGFFPATFGLEAHSATAFPLEASHTAVSCGACHQDDVGAGARLFVGTDATCATCHEDVHEPPFASFGCSECHTTTTFDDVEAEAFDHARWTSFALDGAHAAADCEACHPRAAHADGLGRAFGRVSAAFGEPASSCATCHTDPHGGAFAGESCGACHTTAHFAELAGTFEHSARTGFALTGAHREAECASCHGTYPDPILAGRSLGRVSQVFPGPVERCDTCHADVHQGAFGGAGRPEFVDGRQGCARCHVAAAFEETIGTFDHAQWTDHRLEGAHAALDCGACHPSSSGALGRATGTDCAACHLDPHVGQFAESGRTDCAQCHLETHSFDDLTFDHRRGSRFALDESHEGLACSACHVPWPLADGSEAVRYKPLGTRCIDCHDHGGGGGR